MVLRILGPSLVKPEDDSVTIRTGERVNVNGGWYKTAAVVQLTEYSTPNEYSTVLAPARVEPAWRRDKNRRVRQQLQRRSL
jgi:hypothetical protein